MSRPERIEFEGAYYHVMNRGRRRNTIFHGEEYYTLFLETVSEVVTKFNLQVLSYCLMTNHYHLLVKTPDGNLQRAMRHIGGVYTQRHNHLKGCDGSLFRGRYKAILVDSDEYLLHLSKYIHLNPLQAKIVENLDDYQWSSYPAFVNKRKAEKWLSKNEVYDQLTSSRLKAKRYRSYVEEQALAPEIESFYAKRRRSAVLGSEGFVEWVANLDTHKRSSEVARGDRVQARPSFAEVVNVVSDAYGVTAAELVRVKKGRGVKNFPRKVAMYVSQIRGQYRLNEIAAYFGLRHYGGVSSAISAVKRELDESTRVKKQINSIINRFDP